MAISFTLLKELSILSQGRNPIFTELTSVDEGSEPGPPATLTEGVATDGAIITLVGVKLRQNVQVQRAVVTVDVVDVTSTYRVTLNGTDFDYVAGGGDTEIDILNGLQTVIDADADFSAQVYVTGLELWVDGTGVTVYTTTVTVIGGTGVLLFYQDAHVAQWRLWGIPQDQTYWVAMPLLQGNVFTRTNAENVLERVISAGFDRIYVEVLRSVEGRTTPIVAPCELE
jgi:hypothetical protein